MNILEHYEMSCFRFWFFGLELCFYSEFIIITGDTKKFNVSKHQRVKRRREKKTSIVIKETNEFLRYFIFLSGFFFFFQPLLVQNCIMGSVQAKRKILRL